MSLVKAVDLCQKYENRDILKDINLEVARGEVFALIGPTGAGKTTLLRLLDLLDTPASGSIYFDGIDATRSDKLSLKIRRRMSFVLQKPVVFNTSVYDNIAYGLKWRGLTGSSLQQRVHRILEMVGLSGDKDRNARTLSGGEAQRVAISRAIATEPELLLLDEPTANLDPNSTARIEELVSDIIQQHNTTIIMATHDTAQGQRLANRMGVLINGEVHQIGAAAELFTSPETREVARFVGMENIIDGVVAASEAGLVTLDINGQSIEALSDYPAGAGVYACIRPEDITLSPSAAPSSARNSFRGRITRLTTVGALTRIEIDCGFPLITVVTTRSAQEMDLAKDKPLYATFKATAVHVLKRG